MLIGYALCGSFCTFSRSIAVLEKLVSDGHRVIPIMSASAFGTDTRFGEAAKIRGHIEALCGSEIICSIEKAEPLGPKVKLDIMVVSPCTGNTLAKLAHGITDTPVTMACKAHLRCDRPLLLALASNDAMSGNFANLAAMLNRKAVYLVPMMQDDPIGKPHSLVAQFERIPEALEAAVAGHQLRPLFV